MRAWLAVLTLCGCASSAAGPSEDARCLGRVWYLPDRALARDDLKLTPAAANAPELVGSFEGFRRPGLRQFAQLVGPGQGGAQERFLTISLPLAPGPYTYGILVGDALLTDDIQPQSVFGRDLRYSDSGPYEAEYTLINIPDCAAPTLTLTEAASSTDTGGQGALRWVADFVPGQPGGELDAASLSVVLVRGEDRLPSPVINPQPPRDDGGRSVIVTASGLLPGKYTLTLSARGLDGQIPTPLLTSLFIEPPATWRGDTNLHPPRPLADAVIYQIMIDRFRGDAGALAAPATPGLRAGGTLGGVQAAIDAGYFDRLGVTTLWLSPVYQNPTGTYPGLDGHDYESYHGYWPSAPRTVEPRFGGAAALQSLVAAAHTRGLRVIFDAVPNHVHALHPYYRDHSRQAPPVAQAAEVAAASWFNDGPTSCVCGTPGCDWGSRIEDCWFALYLPDLNWRHPDVMQTGVDDLLWWLTQFDLDGMRIDAVPMMPRAATRRIVSATHAAFRRSGLDSILIGEDYTGPGQAGRIDIRSFLGSAYDGLDSAFDFPLMWATRSALADESSGLVDLEAEIAHSVAAWDGSGAVMAHMLDNHDTPRFLSEAAGNAGNDPWRDPPPQPPLDDVETYRKQQLGLALIYTLPGIPVIYYGDEIGLAGATDPDSRRTLPDVLSPNSALSSAQAEVLATSGRLGRLRACAPSLRRGVRQPLASGADFTVALHSSDGGGPVVVALLRARADQAVTVSGLPAGSYREVFSGLTFSTTDDGRATLSLRALRPAIYLRDGDPCLSD